MEAFRSERKAFIRPGTLSSPTRLIEYTTLGHLTRVQEKGGRVEHHDVALPGHRTDVGVTEW